MAAKPPVVRMLEQRGVPFTTHQFEDTVRSADEVARRTGLPPQRVFKTLVVETTPPGRPVLVMAPAGREVDLKKVAAATGVKRARMATHRDAERLTGLKVGGISALALAGRRWAVLLDESARGQPTVLVSAGVRGLDVEIAVDDLASLTGATFADTTVSER